MKIGLDPKVIRDLIGSIPFFDGFTDSQKQKIALLKTDVIRFDPGEVIIREGDYAKTLFLLLRGVVRVTKFRPVELLVTKLNEGSMFGELSWLGKRDRITSVIADKNVIVLKLDLDDLKKFDLETKDKIKDKIIEILILRLEDMNKRLVKLDRRK